jgi:hypothetical protein
MSPVELSDEIDVSEIIASSNIVIPKPATSFVLIFISFMLNIIQIAPSRLWKLFGSQT